MNTAQTATPDTRKFIAYEDLRRRQNDLLLRLADTLPRVDGLPPETLEQARDAVFHSDHPFLLTWIGPFGAGKSSLVNALLGEEVLLTGPVPTTDRITIIRHGRATEESKAAEGTITIFHPAQLLELVSLVDTPGLESVFKEHSQKTERFLHRSDLVVLVMLSTQAFSASNLRYLSDLRDYGKRVIVAVNQADLLEADQRETVRDFVREQCLIHLLLEPEIFLVSARQGLAARKIDDPSGWKASGMAALETYITDVLDDRQRLSQKLQTPLQIARNALASAQDTVQRKQAALDGHRAMRDNIEAQISESRAERQKFVDEASNELDAAFAQAARRGEEAIRQLFLPTRALAQFSGGVANLLGIARLFRRLGRRSQAAVALDEANVFAPLEAIDKAYNTLGPRIEGRDMQEADELAAYTRQALDSLPNDLRSKVIGEVRGPVTYERDHLRAARGALDAVLNEARTLEPARLDRAVRNTLIMLAGWEVAVVLVLCLLGASGLQTEDAAGPLLVIALALVLIAGGFLLMPLRGLTLARRYARRMDELGAQAKTVVQDAAAAQIEYGTRIRRDIAAPFTRLVAAQHTLQVELGGDLRALDEDVAQMAGEVAALWQG